MRVFLRTKRTGLYYRSPGELCVGLREASQFASIPAAAQYALAKQLEDVEIALRCDFLDREVLLPVMPAWCELDRAHGVPLSTSTTPSPDSDHAVTPP
jgi:hypothetical protein